MGDPQSPPWLKITPKSWSSMTWIWGTPHALGNRHIETTVMISSGPFTSYKDLKFHL